MYNDVNLDKRHLERISGSVIVATTAQHVEFVDKSLKRSFPLYSALNMEPGALLTFSVEFDGYLSFDDGSYVKILDSPLPYQRDRYDPSAFAVVWPPDATKYENNN